MQKDSSCRDAFVIDLGTLYYPGGDTAKVMKCINCERVIIFQR